MVDTQQLQSAPQCVSGVAEVAAQRAGSHPDHLTHALEVASYFPLDVDTVSRMLESLCERDDISMLARDGLTFVHIDEPDAYNLRMLDIDAGEHLTSNTSLLKHLAVLRSDEAWMRRVRDQHTILRVAAEARARTLELAYFSNRCDLPSAKVQSVLNDLGASGYVLAEVDDDAELVRYTFPDFAYPKRRQQRNMQLLDELEASPVRPALLFALAAAVFIAFALALSLR